MKNDNLVFDFWLLYEKVVSTLPEKIVESPEVADFKKSVAECGMGEINFSAIVLPFNNRKRNEEAFRNLVDILIATGKAEDFDYDRYYNQYLEKQKEQNKELPLTDFVQILIDDGKIPAIDYKEYKEKVLSKRVNKEKALDNINSTRFYQEKEDNNIESIPTPTPIHKIK